MVAVVARAIMVTVLRSALRNLLLCWVRRESAVRAVVAGQWRFWFWVGRVL